MANQSTRKILLPIGTAVIIIAALFFVFSDINKQEANAGDTANAQKQQTAASNQPAENANMAPDFTLNNLQGEEVSLSDYKGKVVFVNFWATWCNPCRQEIPHFIDFMEEYNDDFVVLGIALDPREFDKVPGFVQSMDINYPVLMDKKGVSQLYGGIRAIPTTFVVNRDGEIVDKIRGSRPKEVFKEIIESYL
ncbi:MAG: redoxin domain-containing protein [Caldithrix sp.]|nr:redoxin domain-containing protein [Caldithrix sp.]